MKELVIRENADVLYAREQPAVAMGQSIFESMFADFEMDTFSLNDSADVLGLFDLFNSPELESFDMELLENGDEQLGLGKDPQEAPVLEASATEQSPDSTIAAQPRRCLLDEVQLRAAMQKLPVCSHCRKRRIKCDTELPACRNCQKLHKDCSYRDNALGEEIPRK